MCIFLGDQRLELSLFIAFMGYTTEALVEVQEAPGDEAGRQHHLVDVAMLRPAASFAMRRVEPKRLDSGTESDERGEPLEKLACACATCDQAILPFDLFFDQLDRGKPCCEAELAKRETS